ncbi:unnamed protein product [Oikopleura dioica]|uniref:Cystathionine gamma-lyase n=1 Tax=Oikopleura dioica TaxID=34765 RepID=E4Y6F0_OIKDI|nr:unnamed protein product [Oikopleura dioica]
MSKFSFETDVIHGGFAPDKSNFFSVSAPITMSSTYKMADIGIPDLTNGTYIYSRLGNPTREALEKSIAKLENAKHGFAFASGMAAITACVQFLAKSGDHVICADDVYGGTNWYFSNIAKQNGLNVEMLNLRDISGLTKKVNKKTKLVLFETVTNPLIKVNDVSTIAKAVHEINKDCLVIIDNTFLTPWNMRPLEHGADVVLHSASKYINGHSDCVCGLVATSNDSVRDALFGAQVYLGGVPSPFDSFLVSRGMKTLHLRMPRHYENALKIAKWLQTNEKIEKIWYPGLESHEGYEVLKKLSRTAGGLITFTIKGSEEQARRFLQSTKLISLAVSLGGYESLAQHPYSMTHANVTEEHKKKIGITKNMIRLSVGLENVDDLINDIENAINIAVSDEHDMKKTITVAPVVEKCATVGN